MTEYICALNIFLKTEKKLTKIQFSLLDSQWPNLFFWSCKGIDDTNKHDMFEAEAVLLCLVGTGTD